MGSELDHIKRTKPGEWSEEQIDYLISNTGHFSVMDIASFIGKRNAETRDKIIEIGLDPTNHGLPEALNDLQCIPNGMTVRACKSGRVYRVPTSTPGIVSRTVHVPMWTQDQEEESHAG